MPTPSVDNLVLAAARQYLSLGLSVIPIALDGSKAPATSLLPMDPDPQRPDRFKASWKRYQSAGATDGELIKWFGGPFGSRSPAGIGIVCGKVSGNLEVLDFDDPATAALFFEQVRLDDDLQFMIEQIPLVRTPGGIHLYYHCSEIAGAQKLAWPARGADGKAGKCLIETRGEGNYVIAPGSPQTVHPSHRPYQWDCGLGNLRGAGITLSPGQRTRLHLLARSFNQDIAPALPRPVAHKPPPVAHNGPVKPWDDFDIRGSWEELLVEAGCRLYSGSWEEGRVVRPGKEESGLSATIGYCRGKQGEPLLYCFTSSWPGLDINHTYGRYRFLTLTKFQGDHKRACAYLVQKGYGAPSRQSLPRPAAFPAPAPVSAADEPTQLDLGYQVSYDESPSEQPAPPPKRFRVSDLMKMDFPDIQFVVGELIPEGLTLFSGAPKAGKSYLVLQLAIAVSSGTPALSRLSTKPGAVLYLTLEDRERRIQHRLKSMYGPEHVYPDNFEIQPTSPFSSDGGVEHIRQWIRDTADPRLVIVDTFQKFRDPSAGRGQTYETDYAAVAALKSLADDCGVAVVIVHHTRKSAAPSAFDETSGTRGLTGAADTMVILSRDGSAGTMLVTGRDIEDTTHQLERDGMCWKVVSTDSGINRPDKPTPLPPAVAEAVDWLRKELSNGPRFVSDLRNDLDKAGITTGSFYRASEVLKVREDTASKRLDGTGRSYQRWSLPGVLSNVQPLGVLDIGQNSETEPVSDNEIVWPN